MRGVPLQIDAQLMLREDYVQQAKLPHCAASHQKIKRVEPN